MAKTATINLRLDPELGERVKAEALRQRVSSNKLLVDAVKQYLKAQKEREWSKGFAELGQDPEGNDVEFMLPAGLEAVDAE